MQLVNTQIEEKTVIDKETGEILDSQIITNKQVNLTRKVKNYNEFIMVYLEDISSFLKIDNATQIKVLALIWRDAKYNNPETNDGNVMAILKDDKERWANEIKVNTRTIDNALSALVRKNILISVCKGKYKLNPLYYFKGSNSDRKKILNVQVEYEFEENESENESENIND